MNISVSSPIKRPQFLNNVGIQYPANPLIETARAALTQLGKEEIKNPEWAARALPHLQLYLLDHIRAALVLPSLDTRKEGTFECSLKVEDPSRVTPDLFFRFPNIPGITYERAPYCVVEDPLGIASAMKRKGISSIKFMAPTPEIYEENGEIGTKGLPRGIIEKAIFGLFEDTDLPQMAGVVYTQFTPSSATDAFGRREKSISAECWHRIKSMSSSHQIIEHVRGQVWSIANPEEKEDIIRELSRKSTYLSESQETLIDGLEVRIFVYQLEKTIQDRTPLMRQIIISWLLLDRTYGVFASWLTSYSLATVEAITKEVYVPSSFSQEEIIFMVNRYKHIISSNMQKGQDFSETLDSESFFTTINTAIDVLSGRNLGIVLRLLEDILNYYKVVSTNNVPFLARISSSLDRSRIKYLTPVS